MPVSTKPCMNPECERPGAEYVRDVEKRVGRDQAARVVVSSWVYLCRACGRESAYPAVRDGGAE